MSQSTVRQEDYLGEWFDPGFRFTEERYRVGEYEDGRSFLKDTEVCWEKNFQDLSALAVFIRDCGSEKELLRALMY